MRIYKKTELLESLRNNCVSLDDEDRLEIVTKLFNKFDTSWKLSEYLKSKGVDVE